MNQIALAPHILKGAVAKPGRGRRRPGQPHKPGPHRWHTLLALTDGNLTYAEPASPNVPTNQQRLGLGQGQGQGQRQGQLRLQGPAALVLQAGTAYTLKIPAQSEFAWVDWGLIAAPQQPLTKSKGWHYDSSQANAQQPPLDDILQCTIPLVLPTDLTNAAVSTCLELSSEWFRGPIGQLQAINRLTTWLTSLHQHFGQTNDRTDHNADPILTSAERHLDQSLNVAAWARRAGVSRQWLTRYCRRTWNCSPLTKINQLRQQRATHLLQATNKPINDVAKLCGFHSPDAFRNWCRQQFNATPTEIKRQPKP